MGVLFNGAQRGDLKPGDHIYTWRVVYAYSHHGIYMGGDKVVHFTQERDETSGFGAWLNTSAPSSSIPSNLKLQNPSASASNFPSNLNLPNPSVSTSNFSENLKLPNPSASASNFPSNLNLPNPSVSTSNFSANLKLPNPSGSTSYFLENLKLPNPSASASNFPSNLNLPNPSASTSNFSANLKVPSPSGSTSKFPSNLNSSDSSGSGSNSDSFNSFASGSNLASTCSNFPACGFKSPNSGVVLSCLDCFLGSGSLYLFEYEVTPSIFFAKVRGGTCTTAKSDPTDMVIHRAMYLLQKGFGNYDIFLNNCEDFALYCKTGLLTPYKSGVGRSGQAASVVGAPLAAILATSLRFLMPAPVGMALTAGMYCVSRYATDIGVRSNVIKVAVEDMSVDLGWVRNPGKEAVEEDEEVAKYLSALNSLFPR